MFSARKVAGKLVKSIQIVRGSTKSGHCQEVVTQNEMPVPSGDFRRLHNQRQMRYNSVLALGIAMVSMGFLLLKQSPMKLHFSPPDTYE